MMRSFCARRLGIRGVNGQGVAAGRRSNRAAEGESSWRMGRFCAGMLLATLLCLGPETSPAVQAQEAPAEAGKSSSEALALYADAAALQNNNAFETAAEEWAKFIERYPKDPLLPKAQYYHGVCELQLKRYEKAATSFAAVLKNFPKFELAEDAMLNLAWCRYSMAQQGKNELYAEAAKTFEALAEKFPKGKHADEAFYYLGESLYLSGQRKEAVSAYATVVENYADSKLRCDALYALGATLEELDQFKDAGEVYAAFLKDCPESPLVTEVRMRKANTILQQGGFAEAEKIFGEVAAVENFASADFATLRQAYCNLKQDKLVEAATLYARVVTTYPDSPYKQEATLAAGLAYYRADQMPQAVEWLQQAVEAGGADVGEAGHWLARAHLRLDKPNAALQVAGQILPNLKPEDAFFVYLKMDQADALYEQPEKRADAVTAYAALAEQFPQHTLAPQALYNAAFGKLEVKDYDSARTLANDFRQKYPEHALLADVQYVAAESLLQQGKHAEAEPIFAELAKRSGERPEFDAWRTRHGLTLYLQQKYDQVVSTLGPVAADMKSPEVQAEAYFLVGASHFFQDQFAPAATALEASRQASAQWAQADEVLLLLSRTQRKLDKTVEAIATVRKLLEQYPESRMLDQARYRLGEYAYAAQDYAAAIANYEQVIAESPESAFVPYAFYGKGWAQVNLQQYAEAAKSFTSLLEEHAQHPLVAESLFARAVARRQSRDFAGVIADVDAFLKASPEAATRSDALYEKGLAQVALKEHEAAATTFAAILKAEPKYTHADKVLYEQAWAYKSLGDAVKAVATFAQLANDHPDSPLAAEAFYHVAEDQYEKKEFEDAVLSYQKAKEKAAAGQADLLEKTLYKLGWSHYQLKNYAQALPAFNEQVEKYPQGPLFADGQFMKGETLFKQEEYDQALAVFTAALDSKASSENIEVLIRLHGGQSAAQLEMWRESLAMLKDLPEKYPKSAYLAEAYYERGWAKKNLDQTQEAFQDFNKAAEESRGSIGARARFMMGEILFGQKQYEEAVKEFQRVMFTYGGENAEPEVRKWQAKAGYEAARCFDVRIADAPAGERGKLIDEAKKLYSYVVQRHPESPEAPVAKRRLDAVSKL